MGNYFSYMRISTKENADKQSFARQKKAMKKFELDNDIEFLASFQDDSTGSTFERKEWKRLEKAVREGDTIVFKEISRFTREAEEGFKVYMDLLNRGVNLIFIDNPTVSTDYIKQLMQVAAAQQRVAKKALENTIELLLIVELDRVQQEREIIVKRIKQGIEASSKKQGRKKGSADKLTEELKEDLIKYMNDPTRSIKQKDVMEKHNIKSRHTFKRYLEMVQGEE